MKKYITFSIFVFCATALIIFVGNLVYNKNQTVTNFQVNKSTTTTTFLTKTELVKHNTSNSCWLLISGKIYDVTSYVNQHPGGVNEILKTCGTDATVAYDTKDNQGRPHSNEASQMLQEYYIGDIGSNQ